MGSTEPRRRRRRLGRRRSGNTTEEGPIPAKLSNPRDLFLQLLGQTLWIERTLAHKVLPTLAKETKSESLAALFEQHLQETLGHVANAERAFHHASAEVSSNLDHGAEKLFAQHDELAGSVVEDVLRDVFHAAGAVTAEHYELARYDALIVLAGALDLDEARELLEQSRREDAAALDQAEDALRRLATEM